MQFVRRFSSSRVSRSLFSDYLQKIRPSIPAISVHQLHDKLSSERTGENVPSSLVVLDVRETYEWNESHIPFAIYTGRGCLERDIESIVPDTSDEIVVYCAGGNRSLLAAESLLKLGYKNVSNLEGGIGEWKNNNLLTIKNRVAYQDRIKEYTN